MVRGKHAKPPHKRILRDIASFLLMIAAVLLLSWAMRTYVFQAYQIPTSSMDDTISIGDMVFAEKITYYGREPQAGDIVTFEDPTGERDVDGSVRTLIKRVIAVGGQTVDIKTGVLYIDGQPQTESYVDGKPTYILASSKISFPYVVPQGYVWVMGDNRTNSQDSRYFGAIPITSVTAKAVFTYWPIEHFGGLE